jgi:hypothetical protein
MFDWVALDDITRKATALDAHAGTDDELLGAVRSVVSAQARLDATLGHLLAELDTRKTTEDAVGLTTASWFARTAGVSVSAGKDRVRVARQLRDGVTYVSGSLAGEWAEVARHAIETMADELFRRYSGDHERTPDIVVPEHRTLRALAFVELSRRGLALDLGSTAAPRADITLVVRAEDPDRAVSADGVAMADGSTRALRCDPDLTPVIVDRLGVPLDMGRRTRRAPPAQRRALAVRDGGCIFPGCDAPNSWTDAHHVEHFEAGGPTSLENMASLCRRHHGVTHRTGWQMRPAGSGRFTWTTPSRQTLHSQRHGRTEADRPP